MKLRAASAGASGSLRRLRLLHQAIVEREEQGETLSRLLPGGVAEKLRRDGAKIGAVEELDVTVLMVTHEPDVGNRAERVVVLKDGLIASDTLNNGS